MRSISPSEVRLRFIARAEIALLDLREESVFASAHPLFASQLSFDRIETEILDRIPRKSTHIVLYDDDDGLVEPAAAKLAALGYDMIDSLAGGLNGWRDAGYELFQDVNSYSKAFGELVEVERKTPSLTAERVHSLIHEGADIAILDARRFDEYNVMSIPQGVSTPGAELVLRAQNVAPDPATTIIVNCAGRTRSIIGTQSLVNAGLPNPIYALRNGTIGWTLAGQTLDTGQTRSAPMPEERALAEAQDRARAVAYRAGVKRLRLSEVEMLEQQRNRTLYRLDVRTPDEYRQGHICGFRNAPGGQLVQETDMVAPVRGARIVLADDLFVRADMSASWLAQMGWEVYVLEDGFECALESGDWQPTLPVLPPVEWISQAELGEALDREEIALFDLGTSKEHRLGHLPGARFVMRKELGHWLARMADNASAVLLSRDGAHAAFAAADNPQRVRVLTGGTQGWKEQGLPVEKGFDNALSEPVDTYKRPYEGTGNSRDAMQSYLDWEYGLVAQLEKDGTHGFTVI